jgi:hypothetical protein
VGLELRESARTTLRGFIDHIVIPPGDALLQVVGNLGEMLTAALAPHEAAAVGVMMVAGACNQRYLQLWCVAS